MTEAIGCTAWYLHPGADFHIDSDELTDTSKRHTEKEAKTEKMKRCVFTASQPIHYVGVGRACAYTVTQSIKHTRETRLEKRYGCLCA